MHPLKKKKCRRWWGRGGASSQSGASWRTDGSIVVADAETPSDDATPDIIVTCTPARRWILGRGDVAVADASVRGRFQQLQESYGHFPVCVAKTQYFYGYGTARDYDYTELLLHATWLERYSLEYGYSNDIYGWGAAGQHWEARGDWPLRNAWILGAGLGYNVLDEQGTSNHWYWDIGASARFGWLMVDLRWYDNETPAGSLAYLSAGSQWVLSLSAGF